MRLASASRPDLQSLRWRAGHTLAARGRLAILCATALLVSLALPWGFAGWDDLHYLQAAQRWLAIGVHVPADHWATRLPYVLTIALSLRLFGLSVLALSVPNSVCFLLILVLLWRIGDRIFGERAAFWTAFAAASTPLLLRMPSTFYPEVMEVALGAGATALVLAALRTARAPAGWLLFAAGLAGGLSILVRQTSIALAPALALLVMLEAAGERRRAVRQVCVLACGFAIPVLFEMLFYLVLTGHPLDRLRIDSTHVLVPSVHLRGGTFHGFPLFNWQLAARWDVPSMIDVHWTVNPLLRLFTSPGLLLTPVLCVAGGVLAMRAGRGLPRNYTLFALSAVLLQYVVNTFVLVIAPDTRYMLQSLALCLPLAGLLLARLTVRTRLLTAGLAMALPCIAALAVEPSPAHLLPALEKLAGRGVPIHVSINMREAAYIATGNSASLDKALVLFTSSDTVPVGSLAVIDPYGAASLSDRCASGPLRWQPVERTAPLVGQWNVAPLLAGLPAGIARRLEARAHRLVLVRRVC